MTVDRDCQLVWGGRSQVVPRQWIVNPPRAGSIPVVRPVKKKIDRIQFIVIFYNESNDEWLTI